MSEEKTRQILEKIRKLSKEVQNTKKNQIKNFNNELLRKVYKTLEKVILYLKNK